MRIAGPKDAAALERLAALDEKPAFGAGPALVAEFDGVLWAALELQTGRCIADPFVPSLNAVELLRLRAEQIGRVDAGLKLGSGSMERGGAPATVGA